jgi:type I restriction enzyme S subunit
MESAAGLERFRPYPEYKDSGTEWLSGVPRDWDVIRLKSALSVSREKNGKSPVGEMLSVSGYRGVEPKVYEHEEQRRADEDLEDYRVVRKSQLVANTMWLNYSGLGVSDYEGHVSPAYRCYDIGAKYHGKFLHHLMRSSTYVGRYCGLLYGVRPNSLQIKNHDWDSIELLIPPVPEQRAIAEFLDRETGKIDALVAKKERLIELLQEKRTALITHAVTKGLDPTAPTKPSGIPWLGNIPAHWESTFLDKAVDPLRRITYGIVQPGPPDSDGRFMVRGQNYSRGWSDPEAIFRVSHGVEAPYKRARLAPGDIVMTIVGAGTGNVAIVPNWLDGANITQTTARIAIAEGRGTNAFFKYQLESQVGQRNVELTVKGAAQPGINLAHLAKYQLVLPPVSEQTEIARYLDKRTGQFEDLIESIGSAIDRLKEFRTALISAAVTGKIDVREEVA